jgi:pseudouridine-5'-monophosphatase
MPPHAQITHVCFDMDGLLLSTEECYSVAQTRVLDDLGVGGHRFTPALKRKMMGRPALAAAETLVSELDIGAIISPADFVAAREAVLADLFPSCEAMPGAEALVHHLKDNNIPIAVATSSHRRHFDLKTARHAAMFARFDHVVTGCDPALGGRGKPDPAIFRVAASRFASPPADPATVLVFEDAPIGVAAARAAGMRCVHVPDARWAAAGEEEGEGDVGACATLASLADFRPEEWGLPPF